MTIEELYRNYSKSLSLVSESPALDSRLIIQHALGLSQTEFITQAFKEVAKTDENKISELFKLRQEGLPVAYIVEHRDFYKNTFYTPKNVLIPQPDTEILVEEAINTIRKNFMNKKVSVLDVCAGTGCVGISIADEVNCELSLSDISQDAFNAFSKNTERILNKKIKVNRYLGDMFEPVAGKKFDIIVSNPPYIQTGVIPTLPDDVKAEPVLALDGGSDGLVFYRSIGKNARFYLEKNGFLLVEIGFDQGPAVSKIMHDSGFDQVEIIKDIGNRDRVVKCSI